MLDCNLIYWSLTRHIRRRQWHPTPVLLPGKSHGWRSLVGCSLWGRKESNTTVTFTFTSILYIGEGNGNPLQYCCLENPMDGGPWWAAVHGIAKSQAWLSDFTFTFHFPALEKEMATHSSVLAGESQGRGSLVGCRLRDHTESDTTEAT